MQALSLADGCAEARLSAGLRRYSDVENMLAAPRMVGCVFLHFEAFDKIFAF
ncbi:hypothetical protein JYP49_16350 [Nitratireductor aquimarinus]|uniref:hypothetical protein n=1 Tax=Nitratireductor TaxID=245876 RepID=UPI0019D3CFD0|nr:MULTISPECIES: hypothetical protein [Nitratireductor]MBN7777844.1 hypothetical protein [Nitratireductor pacificus]MBN7782166.1 hypothetical protein [Nitratireductor pacificus]MBN7790973.1 hypothetical protein [Nitratireductor aquimarinus]MBY6100054.1 hypothetical protein [Nitratireductor aquimarinus]MCA1262441.1 hypothetical protein [Nitratireductor aquimarinus]